MTPSKPTPPSEKRCGGSGILDPLPRFSSTLACPGCPDCQPCPTCKSDDPAFAFDVLRPDAPKRPLIWTSSDGADNYLCGDPFHDSASVIGDDGQCLTCGSDDPAFMPGGYSADFGSWTPCPDLFHSPDVPLIDTKDHSSPEADEQVGGERWTIKVCGFNGCASVHDRDRCPECDAIAPETSIEVVPASSSIPTEKVRELVQWAGDVTPATRYALTDEALLAAYKLGAKSVASRLSALVEGTE